MTTPVLAWMKKPYVDPLSREYERRAFSPMSASSACTWELNIFKTQYHSFQNYYSAIDAFRTNQFETRL